MADYRTSEAREWAKATLRGVANVLIPTFTHDLQSVNERAIRHDVRKEIEYGFWGALLVAETATTLQEYIQCLEWAVDEAGGKHYRRAGGGARRRRIGLAFVSGKLLSRE